MFNIKVDCHYNTITLDKCQQIVDLCASEGVFPETLVITCSGEKQFDQNNLRPLESLKSVKTVTFQGWYVKMLSVRYRSLLKF